MTHPKNHHGANWLADLHAGPRGKFLIDRGAWRLRKIAKNGSDVIVPQVALENLLDILRVFQMYGASAWPINGTLLGLVRDGTLIPHDSDVDLGALWSQRVEIHKALFELKSQGFEIIRVSQRADGISLMRNDEYVDISLYKVEWGIFRRYLTSAWGAIDPVRLSLPLVELRVGDHSFPVPHKAEDLLKFWFGNSWRTPERGRSRRCDVPSIFLKRTIQSRTKFLVDKLYLWTRPLAVGWGGSQDRAHPRKSPGDTV